MEVRGWMTPLLDCSRKEHPFSLGCSDLARFTWGCCSYSVQGNQRIFPCTPSESPKTTSLPDLSAAC